MTFQARQPRISSGWSEYISPPRRGYINRKGVDRRRERCPKSSSLPPFLTGPSNTRPSRRGFNFGDTVAIQGLGAIGMTMTAKARMLGAGKVIVLDFKEKNLELARNSAQTLPSTLPDCRRTTLSTIRSHTEGRRGCVRRGRWPSRSRRYRA